VELVVRLGIIYLLRGKVSIRRLVGGTLQSVQGQFCWGSEQSSNPSPDLYMQKNWPLQSAAAECIH